MRLPIGVTSGKTALHGSSHPQLCGRIARDVSPRAHRPDEVREEINTLFATIAVTSCAMYGPVTANPAVSVSRPRPHRANLRRDPRRLVLSRARRVPALADRPRATRD